MTALVIAEYENFSIKDETLRVVTAAKKLSGEVWLAVLGYEMERVVNEACCIEGISKVLVIDHEKLKHFIPEVWSFQFLDLLKTNTEISSILISSSSLGKDLLPRIAGMHDEEQLTDVVEIISQNDFLRPIYAGNLVSRVSTEQKRKFLTVRGNKFEPTGKANQNLEGEKIVFKELDTATKILSNSSDNASNTVDLLSAKCVISGGRGLGSAENYRNLLQPLAKKLGAALGASRAAVDMGLAPNENQVGQTGKIVAPDLYIAVGLSGSIQHLAGMKDSKVIVAINKDPEAPIFQIATYGIIADLFEVLPELTEKL